MKTIKLLAVALLLSAGAYAQNSPLPPTTVTPPAAGQRPRDMTPEQRAALKAQHKAKMDAMTPDERKAFRKEHQEKREARLSSMTAEQRERLVERKKKMRKMKKVEKV